MKGMPPYLPRDLIERLQWIVPDPEYWFTGQFVSYILRPTKFVILVYLIPIKKEMTIHFIYLFQ